MWVLDGMTLWFRQSASVKGSVTWLSANALPTYASEPLWLYLRVEYVFKVQAGCKGYRVQSRG